MTKATGSNGVEFEVVSTERVVKTTAASLVFGTDASERAGYAAKVRAEDGGTYYVSRRDGSAEWRIDGFVNANGVPVYMNGHFSVMSNGVFADPAVIAVLDAAVA